MTELEIAYKELIEPENFITTFNTEKEFIDWLKLGTVEDLQATLKAFEKAELYECCKIINDVKNGAK